MEFETMNRRLENFLYFHDILHKRWYKSPDGMTVWVYDKTHYLEQVVAEYLEICARREANKGGSHNA